MDWTVQGVRACTPFPVSRTGILTAADAGKAFTEDSRPLRTKSPSRWLGKLANAAERLEAVVRDSAPLLAVGDLKRLMGKREVATPEQLAQVIGIPAREISSVDELERIFRLE